MKKALVFLLALTLLAGCGAQQTPKEPESTPGEEWATIPMVMIEGEVYLTTGHTALYRTDTAGPEHWDGEITSAIENGRPTEDNQANCAEVGTGWRWGEREGTVELLINKNWVIFATEEVREEMQGEALGAQK